MRKTLLIVLAVFVLVVLGLVIVVAMQPSDVRISRSATIDAPPAEVFPHVNNFHNSLKWSPWAELDPDAKYTFAGPEAGKGASYQWNGNDKVGEGSLTIIESRPNELIRCNLEFVRPMADTAEVVYTFEPEGENTKVTWTMNGQNNFMEKAFCMFMDLDAMVGKDFEKGLSNLNRVVAEKKNDGEQDDNSGAQEAGENSIDADPEETNQKNTQ